MSHLNSRQRTAVERLREVFDVGEEKCIQLLDSNGWDVQRAANAAMQPFDIDDSAVAPPPPAPVPSRPFLAILAFPLHILSNVVRFLFGLLRIPVPQFRFSGLSLNFYRPLPRRPPPPSAPDRWLRDLEEETGAYVRSTAVDSPGEGTLRARHTSESKFLPDFVLGPYDDALRLCAREARIACIILVSEEHDDVPAFKRNTLTDPEFVNLLYEHNILVWGGDVRDREAWSAAEKLQATTFPFVAFLALQPRRSPSSTSTSSSTPPPATLTVLSRHHGPQATSPAALSTHLTTQLLPRVLPFLTRIKDRERERERDRRVRAEQDRAYQESAARDRERIEQRQAEERLERARADEERKRRETEERERREAKDRRERVERLRGEWRLWLRAVFATPAATNASPGLPIALRLPKGGRAMRTFAHEQGLTALYAWVAAELASTEAATHVRTSPEGDVVPEKDAEVEVERILERTIARSEPQHPLADTQQGEWWGFALALAYPRTPVPWAPGVKLGNIPALRGGAQVVVEMLAGAKQPSHSVGDEDDGYVTEDSDEE
ncbi:hypothetical protein H0H81_001766 [Sphagnurus paluster]|uniref:UBX domain-containing protein n=1 Tax=Sphagnurus paluster TaxID=117069 RepID=A0A9P7FMC4_9AGAR|nr:hypothetical protein H0H81_001766 [Sphagnurus paluster]